MPDPADASVLDGPIVLDANILFAAFIRDGPTREIILDWDLDLRSPAWLWDELAARYEWMQRKTGLASEALDELLRQLRSRVADIPEAAVLRCKAEALARTESSGRKDAPYIAAALAVGGVVWTHDQRLAAEAGWPVVSTAAMLAARGS